jgi:hypothetical protein
LPRAFFIVSVAVEGAHPTPETGSCGELLHVFTFRTGVVAENGKPVK